MLNGLSPFRAIGIRPALPVASHDHPPLRSTGGHIPSTAVSATVLSPGMAQAVSCLCHPDQL